jgi:hypothetical protein
MTNHFKIVSNDTKILNGLTEMTENLPDVRKMCQKFMGDLETKVQEDTVFIEGLIRNGESKCKLLQEVDKETFDMMKKDLVLMKNEILT